MYRRSTAAADTCLRAGARRALRESARRLSARPPPSVIAIDARRAPVPLHPLPRFPQDVTPVDAVKQRMETSTRLPLGRTPESALQLSHFVDGLASTGVIGPVLPAMPLRLLARRRYPRRDPSLRPRYSSRPSSVLRSPRTPAAPRSLSPSAYTSRPAATTAAQTGLSCSVLLLVRVLLPLPRRDLPRYSPDWDAAGVAFAVT